MAPKTHKIKENSRTVHFSLGRWFIQPMRWDFVYLHSPNSLFTGSNFTFNSFLYVEVKIIYTCCSNSGFLLCMTSCARTAGPAKGAQHGLGVAWALDPRNGIGARPLNEWLYPVNAPSFHIFPTRVGFCMQVSQVTKSYKSLAGSFATFIFLQPYLRHCEHTFYPSQIQFNWQNVNGLSHFLFWSISTRPSRRKIQLRSKLAYTQF